jgi:hypothetical protein
VFKSLQASEQLWGLFSPDRPLNTPSTLLLLLVRTLCYILNHEVSCRTTYPGKSALWRLHYESRSKLKEANVYSLIAIQRLLPFLREHSIVVSRVPALREKCTTIAWGLAFSGTSIY